MTLGRFLLSNVTEIGNSYPDNVQKKEPDYYLPVYYIAYIIYYIGHIL